MRESRKSEVGGRSRCAWRWMGSRDSLESPQCNLPVGCVVRAGARTRSLVLKVKCRAIFERDCGILGYSSFLPGSGPSDFAEASSRRVSPPELISHVHILRGQGLQPLAIECCAVGAMPATIDGPPR